MHARVGVGQVTAVGDWKCEVQRIDHFESLVHDCGDSAARKMHARIFPAALTQSRIDAPNRTQR